MRLLDLLENENSNLVVIYPGRFHPFHIGHGKVYKYLKQKYKGAQVYIASSDKQDAHKSPFSFLEKKKMMMLAGVDPNAIVKTNVPYVATEITDKFDPDKTIVVYAVSEKDMSEDPRFSFPANGPKLLTRGERKGQPAHVQRWPGVENAKPLRDHSYITTVPTFSFKIRGKDIMSATQIRDMIAKSNEVELEQILQDLYGRNDIPKDIVSLFTSKLKTNSMSESWEEDSLFESLLEAELHHEIQAERKLTGGEKRSKEAHFKKLKKHKGDFVDRYGKEAEGIMHAIATKRAKGESIEEDKPEELLKGFDPKTARALVKLKTKYPQADNVLSALLADVEKNEVDGDIADADQDNKIEKQNKKIADLEKQISDLKNQLMKGK